MKPGFLFVSMLLSFFAVAQMSPFDGSYTIVIKVKSGSLPVGARIELQETDPDTDSCRFMSRPVLMRFEEPGNVLIKNRYNNQSWEGWAKEYAQEATFMTAGHYAVVLNSAERGCMIPEGNNYRVRDRRFHIVYTSPQKEVFLAAVPPERIYSLSQMRGRWGEIRMVELDLP